MRGVSIRAVDAHLRYLERDGVTRDGEKGRVYSAIEDGRRPRGERFSSAVVATGISSVSSSLQRTPYRDGGPALLHPRSHAADGERSWNAQLDWIAVDHHNTGHPHTHILVRGVTDEGKVLNIAGGYIAHGSAIALASW